MAWLKNAEPSAVAVNSILRGQGYIAMSAINVGEVIYTLRKRFSEAKADAFLGALPDLPIEIATPSLATSWLPPG